MNLPGDVTVELIVTTALALLAGLVVYVLARQVTRRIPSAQPGEDRRHRRGGAARSRADVIFAAMFVAYVVVIGSAAVLTHNAFNTRYDLSIFDQVVSVHHRLS